MRDEELKIFLNTKVDLYNQPSFIKADPISIPHLFTKKQDIEIAGFFAATFAWGNRTTIINKSKELMQLMDNAPHSFCIHHTDKDLKNLIAFKHRTFTATDLLYFISFFQQHFKKYKSLEDAFVQQGTTMKEILMGFHQYFFSLTHVPARTRKHVATPERKSSCKRINMFLRWMVRQDNKGVDFGIWKKISPAQLICPIDVHVSRIAKKLQILQRKQTDWQAAEELTIFLRTLDERDPVKYDFALFSLGAMEKY